MRIRDDFSICRKVWDNPARYSWRSLRAGRRNLAVPDSTAVFPRHLSVEGKVSARTGASEWKQIAADVKEVHCEV